MDKLLKMLGLEKLDEDKQKELKEKIETLIDLKAQEKVNEKLEVEKKKLVEEYEEKFDDYKEDITSKFSNFVDGIIDEQMTIPDKVLEYARKGELYADLVEQFKVRLGVDEGLLDEEVKSLLKEAKEEIQNLRGQLDESIEKQLETKGDAQELAAELYVRKKCDGLTVEQSTHVIQMLEGIKDTNEIDKKFNIIVEAYKEDMDDDDEKDEKDKKKKKKKKDMKDDEDEDMDESKKGKGKMINEDLDEENESPIDAHVRSYLKVLTENKI